MKNSKLKIAGLVTVLLVPMASFAEGENAAAFVGPMPASDACQKQLQFSDVSYTELRDKLTSTLKEKNKSLIFMDFRGLQAQIDVMVAHLMSEESYNKNDAKEILVKVEAYLSQFEALLVKAKVNAKTIKDEHVVPLATITSLKAEYDKCKGLNSQFSEMFKILSQLNKDLNEILMMSPARINAQKDAVEKLRDKLDDKNVRLNAKNISEPLNFIQTQINTVTHTFEFDTKVLGLAKN
jgi:hypothetical protein